LEIVALKRAEVCQISNGHPRNIRNSGRCNKFLYEKQVKDPLFQDNSEVSDFKTTKVLMIVHQQKTDMTSSLSRLTRLIETLDGKVKKEALLNQMFKIYFLACRLKNLA
jgi:hypothetical protein